MFAYSDGPFIGLSLNRKIFMLPFANDVYFLLWIERSISTIKSCNVNVFLLYKSPCWELISGANMTLFSRKIALPCAFQWWNVPIEEKKIVKYLTASVKNNTYCLTMVEKDRIGHHIFFMLKQKKINKMPHKLRV